MYFHKTTKPELVETYSGSGKWWKRHLSKHGNSWTNVWVSELFNDKEELVEFALAFSELFDIVSDNQWLNLKPENGLDGGSTSEQFTAEVRKKISNSKREFLRNNQHPHVGMKRTEETKRKIGESSKGRQTFLDKTHTEDSKKKISDKNKGKVRSQEFKDKCRENAKGRKVSEETKLKISEIKLGKKLNMVTRTCPHCGVVGSGANMSRYHFDNCKEK